MARAARLKPDLGRLAVLAIALSVSGLHTADGAPPDLSGFIGIWTFQGGTEVQAVCSGLPVRQMLGGTRASIYPGTTTDLVFDIGCRCAIGLNVDGSTARVVGTQPCVVLPRDNELSGDIDVLTLERPSAGVLTMTLSGINGRLMSARAVGCPLSSLSGSGTLVHTGAGRVDCGDRATAIGILPTSSRGAATCPLGAGQEAAWLQTHDEEDSECSDTTGSRGEGRWVLPDYSGPRDPVCGRSHATSLEICRVDGARFRPVTTAADPAQFYAVLKLGTVCPNGSIEVRKTIDNEDSPTDGDPNLSIGDLGPNQVLGAPGLGTITKLSFCYFRAAASTADVMPGFPDLGFPYAVFHRYAGEQPPWVIAKRWHYSNDEDSQHGINGYDAVDPSVIPEFEGVIEDPQSNTVFNMARVR